MSSGFSGHLLVLNNHKASLKTMTSDEKQKEETATLLCCSTLKRKVRELTWRPGQDDLGQFDGTTKYELCHLCQLLDGN